MRAFHSEVEEIGLQTPSTEKRPLWCIAVLEPWSMPVLQLRYRHAVDEATARANHVVQMAMEGHGNAPYQIIGVARVIGYKVNDNHGDDLSV